MTVQKEREDAEYQTGFKGGTCELTVTLRGILTREEADEIMDGLEPYLRLLQEKYNLRQVSQCIRNQ